MKGGIKRTWTPLGATVLFGEGGQYKNQFSGVGDVCSGGAGSLNAQLQRRRLPRTIVNVFADVVRRSIAGVLASSRRSTAAAMHVWFNWQHLQLDAGFEGNGTVLSNPSGNFHSVKQNFDDLDMFMAGGVIFF